jgi:hypothetical protein
LRRVISLLAKRPTSTSRRELLTKFAAFFQRDQKYKRVLSWLDTIETQPTFPEVGMAERQGKGKRQPSRGKRGSDLQSPKRFGTKKLKKKSAPKPAEKQRRP